MGKPLWQTLLGYALGMAGIATLTWWAPEALVVVALAAAAGAVLAIGAAVDHLARP